MEASNLDREIQAYERLSATIKNHGWAVVANLKLVSIFSDFAVAARYTREHYGSQEVLIRHTGERQVETAPFVQVHVEE
jgi:hypothetical protein